jgi:plastocyanin
MRHRRKYLLALVAVAVAAAVAVATASAAGGAPKSATLLVRGGQSVKIDQFVKDSSRWDPAEVTIKSGGTLTIVNRGDKSDAHSFSIVKKSQLPRTVNQINNCAICAQISVAHGINPNGPPSGPPPKPVVDVGTAGFDEPGDSDARLHPGFKSVKEKITAKPGTTLWFLCAVHPWMQGRIKVEK